MIFFPQASFNDENGRNVNQSLLENTIRHSRRIRKANQNVTRLVITYCFIFTITDLLLTSLRLYYVVYYKYTEQEFFRILVLINNLLLFSGNSFTIVFFYLFDTQYKQFFNQFFCSFRGNTPSNRPSHRPTNASISNRNEKTLIVQNEWTSATILSVIIIE